MTITHTDSKQPFPSPAPAERRYLLVDGALFTEGTRWFDEHDAITKPIPVLADGHYDALSPMGPLLIPLVEDCGLARLWQQHHDRLQTGSIFHVTCPEQVLVHWLRARSQIRMPDGRVVWLRLGDAAILQRLLNSAHVPAHFWVGVSGISLATTKGFNHYKYEDTGTQPILAERAEPWFHFTPALVTTLENTTTHGHREVS